MFAITAIQLRSKFWYTIASRAIRWLNSVSFIYNSSVKSKISNSYGAISDYTQVIKLNSNNDDAFYNRGLEKHNLNQYYEAISDYSKAIEINKKFKKAFLSRSVSKSKIGDIKGACTDARKAKSLGYKSIENDNWIKENCNTSFKLF